MQSVLHLLNMIFLPPCSRWQGLKCNLEGICFHACFYKAIMPRAAAWVFGYLPTAAALQCTLEGWISAGLLLNYLGDGGTWNVRHCEAGKKANLACSDSTVCTLCKTAKKYMYWSEKRMKTQLHNSTFTYLLLLGSCNISNTPADDQSVMHRAAPSDISDGRVFNLDYFGAYVQFILLVLLSRSQLKWRVWLILLVNRNILYKSLLSYAVSYTVT